MKMSIKNYLSAVLLFLVCVNAFFFLANFKLRMEMRRLGSVKEAEFQRKISLEKKRIAGQLKKEHHAEAASLRDAGKSLQEEKEKVRRLEEKLKEKGR